MRIIVYALVLFLLAFAAVVRPIWLLYGAAGLSVGIFTRLAWSHARVAVFYLRKLGHAIAPFLKILGLAFVWLAVLFSLVFHNAPWWLYIALLLAVCVRFFLPTVLRQALPDWLQSSPHGRKLAFESLVTALVIVTMSSPFLTLNISDYYMRIDRTISYSYFARVELQPDNVWKINSQLVFRDPADRRNFDAVSSLISRLGQCGWKAEGTIEVIAVRSRTHMAVTRWLPATTLNQISIDEDFRCAGSSFPPAKKSQVVLFAPKYTVGKTYPEASRADVLADGRERLTFPLDFGYDEARVLQLELVSPAFRNAIGVKLLQGAFWEPLLWVWATVCGLFAEQIKRGLILPFARRLFRTVGLRWLEDKNRDNPENKRLIVMP